MREYNHDLAEALLELLDNRNWNYRWSEEYGVVTYRMDLKDHRLHTGECRMIVGDFTIGSTMMFPLAPNPRDPAAMLAMAEFLTRANFNMIYGFFEMDFRTGEIRYHTSLNCHGAILTAEMVNDAINVPAFFIERYAEGIVDVMFGKRTPEQAIIRCENGKPNMAKMLHQLHDSPTDFLKGISSYLTSEMEKAQGGPQIQIAGTGAGQPEAPAAPETPEAPSASEPSDPPAAPDASAAPDTPAS